jgi:hypothetical protein
MEAEAQIQKVHACCKGCVFAELEGRTQTGCELGRIGLFAEEDPAAVLEAYDADGDEFFIVNGRCCTARRSKEWAEKRADSAWVTDVMTELAVQVSYLIVLENGILADQGLERTIVSVLAQSPAPREIRFVNNQSDVPPPQLAARLHKVLKGGAVNWQITQILPQKDGVRRDRGTALDMTIPSLKGHYHTVLLPGFELPDDFAGRLDSQVNRQLRQVVLVRAADALGNGLTCLNQAARHPLVGGHKFETVPADLETGRPEVSGGLIEKLHWLSGDEQFAKTTLSWDALCPTPSSPLSFPSTTMPAGSATACAA